MTRRNRRNSSIQAGFKDYLVPIIGGLLLIILMYSFFSSDTTNTSSEQSKENKDPTAISFNSVNTEAFIQYAGNKKKEQITSSHSFYKGETITVKEGNLSLQNPNGSKIRLNKIAELKYEENGDYSLYSSDAWFDINSDTNISMKFANIQANAGSVLSLTQNEAGSTIYILKGGAKVSNLAGVSTLVMQGQKINISRKDAANEDLDIENEKSKIDSYFKESDWFLENEGHLILSQNNTNEEPLSSTGSELGSKGVYISFENLSDEMSIAKNSLDISGTILSQEVESVTINNKQVSINPSNKSFTLQDLNLGQTVNDIVVKIYDANKNIITKKVYTVYTSARNTSISPSVSSKQKVTTYDVDATDFGFTQPSNTGKFSTSSPEITIRGYTNAPGISGVEVNGFKLASFNGKTWRYHAFKRFETLEEGSNQYRVDYFGEDGSIVYSDYYTIVKKTAITPKVIDTPNEEEIISDEA